MIPILYEKDETAFTSNGLGRLRDVISCTVFEERNGLYECDFSIPMTSDDFEQIQIGRIIAVSHDDSGDIQPFDIVSYERPIEGVVKFHCTHISYRLSYMTVTASSINSLADAFAAFRNAEPNMPFSFQTNKTSTGFVSAFDGLPKTVRSVLGGTEGSLLDAYGGEYEWNKFNVYLHSARGQQRDFSIRYGVNMLDYEEECDIQGNYSSVVPYWASGDDKVVGDRIDSGASTVTGRGECVPMDLSDKFESKPTKAQVEAMAVSQMNSKSPYLPVQNIHVEFVRIQDMSEYQGFSNLLQCNLCDTIQVIFPDYNASGWFKIVKTTWNVLRDRYEEMELGDLSMSLSEALGIDNSSGYNGSGGQPVNPDDYVIDEGTSGDWTYRKWNSGVIEAWYTGTVSCGATSAAGSVYRSSFTLTIPSGIFTATPTKCIIQMSQTTTAPFSIFGVPSSITNINGRCFRATASTTSYYMTITAYVVS